MTYEVSESLRPVAVLCENIDLLVSEGRVSEAELKQAELEEACRFWMETYSEQEGSISLAEVLIQYPSTSFEIILNFVHNL